MNPDPATDRAGLDALRANAPGALERIIERWERPLFAFAWRYVQNDTDAQDLVAEAFVCLHQQRGRLASDTRLSAWLFTILANRCRNLHRWRRRHPSEAIETADDGNGSTPLAVDAPSPSEAVESQETATRLREAVDRLPHDLKTAILLHHYEHLPLREIAGIVGCSERGVETRLYRARQQLREALVSRPAEAVRS